MIHLMPRRWKRRPPEPELNPLFSLEMDHYICGADRQRTVCALKSPECPYKPVRVEASEDHVWLGDLAGFTVEYDEQTGGPVELAHRCGWREEIWPADAYLANIVARAVQVRKVHRCDWPNQAIPR